MNGSKSSTVKVGGRAEDSIKNFENVTGGSGSDVLVGDTSANGLNGGAGNDLLKGGLGNDVLTGGAGDDKFIFDAKLSATSNLDTITDFGDGVDVIALGKSIFSSLKKGVVADNLVTGTSAELGSHTYDKNDFLRYDTDSSTLYYDADGNGAKFQAVAVVELTGVSSLQASDFIII